MSELTLQKRRSGAISGSERITGVKNAQADMLLTRKKQHFNVLMKKKEEEIQLEEFKLHNDSKLLNMENLKNELEYKKRLYPGSDLSNDEMTVKNLQKYLVRNANKLCYTDKSLSNQVRHRASADSIPPIVAEARLTLVKKELIRAIEKNRKHMYNFLQKPVSRQEKERLRQEHDDAFERFTEENRLPAFTEHTAATPAKKDSHNQQEKPKYQGQQYLSLPALGDNLSTTEESHHKLPSKPVQSQPTKLTVTQRPGQHSTRKHISSNHNTHTETQEVHDMLKQNPMLREAIETQQKERAQEAKEKATHSVGAVLSKMARRKPPSKSQIQEEMENVQCQVATFCTNIEKALWAYKEEEFQQSLKFVKDKDAEWNKFMEKMQKRNRIESVEKEEFSTPVVTARSRPKTSNIPKTALAEKERERILMENMLLSKPERKIESAPARKRGIPHHAAERSQHHSPTAKLQRMLEKNRNLLDAVAKAGQSNDKVDPANSSMTVVNKQAETLAV